MNPDSLTSLDDFFQFAESRTNTENGLPPGHPNRRYRLDRMRALCGAFGSPQDSVRTVHLAGSKGKGSTAAYIAALLHASGRRCGIYSSPHLVDYRERFGVTGEPFPEDTACFAAKILLKKLPVLEDDLPGGGRATTFELLTLFAFIFFREAGCDTVVTETGLGGRLDATNVISSPDAVVLTPVEKEHTEILGKKIRQIAGEKAGIVKTGCPVFCAFQPRAALRVFRRTAQNVGADFMPLGNLLKSIKALPRSSEFNWELRWKEGRNERIALTMGGRIQAENAALALAVVRHLKPKETVCSEPLRALSLPGRFQFLGHRPLIVIDGAHTPRSVAALVRTFAQIIPGTETPLLLFGNVSGKNVRGMARILCGGRHALFPEVIISTPGTFKSSNPPETARVFRTFVSHVTLEEDPGRAWEIVLERAGNTRPVLVTGSFFMAGEIAGIENHARSVSV